MSKKFLIFIIILVLIIAGAVFWLWQNYFHYPADDTVELPGTEGETEQPEQEQNLPAQDLPAFLQIAPEPVMFPTIDYPNAKVKYFSASSGKLYETSFIGGQPVETTGTELTNVLNINWSYAADKVIGTFLEPDEHLSQYFFDYPTSRTNVLEPYIKQTAFHPQKDLIAFEYNNPSNNSHYLATATPEGLERQSICPLEISDLLISWAGPDKISWQTRFSGLAPSLLAITDVQTKTTSFILKEEYGLQTKWSPDGEYLLYSKTNNQGKNLNLWLLDAQTERTTQLNLATLADKCNFSADSAIIICAVPQTISPTAVMPDDYYQQKQAFNDNLWQIETASGQKQKLENSLLPTDFDINHILISPQKDYLIFMNTLTGLLYSLRL